MTGEEVLEEYTDANGDVVQKTETVRAIVFGFDFAKDRVLNNDVKKELTGVTARAKIWARRKKTWQTRRKS